MAVTPTTWNPADRGSAVSLSGGDLTADCSLGGSVRSVFGATAGKYYWELTFPFGLNGSLSGVATSSSDLDSYPGGDAESWGADDVSGDVYHAGAVIESSVPGPPTTTLSVLLDATAKTLEFWADGVDFGVTISLTGSQFYAITGSAGTVTANFGATSFNHTPPVGYEAGLGAPPSSTTIYPEGVLVFAAGDPAAEDNGNRTVQADGAAAFAAGEPEAVEGPNRVARASSAVVFAAGAPGAQLGYPETVEVAGVSAFAAGTPEAFPWSHKTIRPAGRCVVGSGSPLVLRGQPAGDATLSVPGVVTFAAGTPTARNAVTLQPQGVVALGAGTPKAYATVHPAGVCVVAAGTPSAGAVLRPAGAAAFRSGTPKAGVIVHPPGTCVVSAGTPRATSAVGTQALGALVFQAGTPRIAGVGVRPRTGLCFRAGTPTINRGTTC